MPYRRRISESRVRENRMHGLMREGRGDPVLYSTLNSSTKSCHSRFRGNPVERLKIPLPNGTIVLDSESSPG